MDGATYISVASPATRTSNPVHRGIGRSMVVKYMQFFLVGIYKAAIRSPSWAVTGFSEPGRQQGASADLARQSNRRCLRWDKVLVGRSSNRPARCAGGMGDPGVISGKGGRAAKLEPSAPSGSGSAIVDAAGGGVAGGWGEEQQADPFSGSPQGTRLRSSETAATSSACRTNAASSPWDGNSGVTLTGAAVGAASGGDLSRLRSRSSGAKVGGNLDAARSDGLMRGRHGGLRCRVGRAGCLRSGSSPVDCQKSNSLSTGQSIGLYRPSIRCL